MKIESLIKKPLAALGLALTFAPTAGAGVVANFPMEISGGSIAESVSGNSYSIEGNFSPMSIASPTGRAWRTDGYTSHIRARVGDIIDGETMTAEILFATDTYPIILQDNRDANNQMAAVVSCLDEGKRSGFGFFMGRTGYYSFRAYVGGELIELRGEGRIPLWEWTNLPLHSKARESHSI